MMRNAFSKSTCRKSATESHNEVAHASLKGGTPN